MCQWTRVTPPVVNQNDTFHLALNSSHINHSSGRMCAQRRVHCVKWWQGVSDGRVGPSFVLRHGHIDSGIESAGTIDSSLGSALPFFFSSFRFRWKKIMDYWEEASHSYLCRVGIIVKDNDSGMRMYDCQTQHKPVSESLTKHVEQHFSAPFQKHAVIRCTRSWGWLLTANKHPSKWELQ